LTRLPWLICSAIFGCAALLQPGEFLVNGPQHLILRPAGVPARQRIHALLHLAGGDADEALDLARAHLQRRHLGEAVAALLDAERAAPEQVQTHTLARETARELLSLTGRRATSELIELARRIGAT
jgi:hypothetical protein